MRGYRNQWPQILKSLGLLAKNMDRNVSHHSWFVCFIVDTADGGTYSTGIDLH